MELKNFISNCNIDQLREIVTPSQDRNHGLKCIIGETGGRYFKYYRGNNEEDGMGITRTGHQCPYSGYVCINDLVKRLEIVGNQDAAKTREIIESIKKIDQEANAYFQRNGGCFQRLMTRIKRFFGNFSYDRSKALETIELRLHAPAPAPAPGPGPGGHGGGHGPVPAQREHHVNAPAPRSHGPAPAPHGVISAAEIQARAQSILTGS